MAHSWDDIIERVLKPLVEKHGLLVPGAAVEWSACLDAAFYTRLPTAPGGERYREWLLLTRKEAEDNLFDRAEWRIGRIVAGLSPEQLREEDMKLAQVGAKPFAVTTGFIPVQPEIGREDSRLVDRGPVPRVSPYEYLGIVREDVKPLTRPLGINIRAEEHVYPNVMQSQGESISMSVVSDPTSWHIEDRWRELNGLPNLPDTSQESSAGTAAALVKDGERRMQQIYEGHPTLAKPGSTDDLRASVAVGAAAETGWFLKEPPPLHPPANGLIRDIGGVLAEITGDYEFAMALGEEADGHAGISTYLTRLHAKLNRIRHERNMAKSQPPAREPRSRRDTRAAGDRWS